MPNSYYENSGNTATPSETTRPQTRMQEAPQAIQPQNATNTPPAPQAQEPPQNNTTMPNNSTGQMVVSVFTASQIYPVVGATVSVTADNGESRDVLASSDTDRSGRSQLFTLPAPSSSMSQEPTAAIPFAEYRVTINHPDFFEAVIENVQVFGGVVTQLPVNLVPLPEISDGEAAKIVIIPRQNL